MNKEEIEFWDRKAKEGELLNAIRANQKRAVSFFGKSAVQNESEGDLYRTIEAYSIVDSSDQDLLAKMNRVHDLMASEFEKLSLSDQARVMSFRSTLRDVLVIKKQAREHLNRVKGGD